MDTNFIWVDVNSVTWQVSVL